MTRYDDVVRQLGEFGRYQKRIYFLLCLPGATHGIRMVLSVFLLYTPKHRCAIPGYDNDTFAVQSPAHAAEINRSVPLTAEGRLDSCRLYTLDSNSSFDGNNRPINASTTACQRWVFDTSVMEKTVTTDFELVCDQAMKTSHATMVYMFGYLVGVFLLGIVSDWFGRKKSFSVSVLLLLSSGTLLAATQNFYVFAVVNFFIGASTAAVWNCAFIIGMELVGPSKRAFTGIVIMFFFAGGLLTLGGVAWLLTNWRILDVVVTLPVLLYLSYWWLIPESPRWLLQKKRYEEAQEVIDKAAKVNGVPPPVIALDKEGAEDADTGCRENRKDNSGGRRRWVILEFCSSPVLLARTFVICFNWFVVSLVYYALSLNVGNLGGEGLHVNFLLSSLVEIPAYGLCLLLLDRLGRRWLHCGVMFLAGLGCAATLFPIFLSDLQWLTVTLAMIGKLGAAAAFGSVYVFTSELFPTVVRNAGMGTASVCARVGGMLAPYIADGGRLMGGAMGKAFPLIVCLSVQGRLMGGAMGKAFPLIVCGCLSLAAGALALRLPETHDQDMADTVKDILALGLRKDDAENGPTKTDKDQKPEVEMTVISDS